MFESKLNIYTVHKSAERKYFVYLLKKYKKWEKLRGKIST